MNKIILMGRLTRDPEVRYTQGENPAAVARYSLAVDRKFKHEGGVTTDFFNIVAFGNRADFSEKYLRKGMKMLIAGRVQTGYYNKDEVKMPFFEVVVEEQEFAESKNASQTAEGSGPGPNGSRGGSYGYGTGPQAEGNKHGVYKNSRTGGKGASRRHSGGGDGSGIAEDADGFLYCADDFDGELPFD